jgi:hypothetical protein
VLLRSHKLVKLGKKGRCVSCKGLRYVNRLRKQVTLSQIAANHGRESSRHDSIYRCKQYDIYLCKERGCFDVFNRDK